MSSHHFVREDQEPGLLVWEWFPGANELISELAQWAPKIIVHERALESFLMHGYKCDIVLFDNEAFCKEITRHHFPIKFHPATANLVEGLKKIQQGVIDRFNVVGDVTFPLDGINLSGIVFYSSDKCFYEVQSGFEKWLSSSARYQIVDEDGSLDIIGNDEIFKHLGQKAYFVEYY